MPPSLATYQQAAQSIYEPQKTAESATLATNKQNTINTLESEKNPINQDYQTAIDDLNSTVLKQTGQINQLYTERLGGNFSGLQGNDLGMMFSSANKMATGIATTRANKLADITVQEGNATNTYNTEIGNLGSKYSSLESEYADKGYGSAVKDYNDNEYKQAQLALSQQRNNIAASRASGGGAASQAAIKQADMGTIGTQLQNKAGKDGHVSQETWNAAINQWLSAGYGGDEFITKYGQFVNNKYDGYHGVN